MNRWRSILRPAVGGHAAWRHSHCPQPPACARSRSRRRQVSSWSQNFALCLREDAAAMHRRGVLTELGPDRNALRGQDKNSVLFDLGLAIPHVDALDKSARPRGGRAAACAGRQKRIRARQPCDGDRPCRAAAPRLHQLLRARRGLSADPAARWPQPGRPAHPCAAEIAKRRPHPCRDRAYPAKAWFRVSRRLSGASGEGRARPRQAVPVRAS